MNEKVNLYGKNQLIFRSHPYFDICFALELTQLVESLPMTVLDFSENLLILLYPLP